MFRCLECGGVCMCGMFWMEMEKEAGEEGVIFMLR